MNLVSRMFVRVVFIFLFSTTVWISTAYAYDRDWELLQINQKGLLVMQKNQPVLRLDAVVDLSCRSFQLFDQGSSNVARNALEKYYATAKSGDFVQHLDVLEADGTLESAGKNIKNSSDLKEAFRNVVGARCVYSLKLHNGVTLYRVVQKVGLPNVALQSFEQKIFFSESCDAANKCRLSARFLRSPGVEALLNILDLAVLNVKSVSRSTSLNSNDFVSGKFLLKKTDRSSDFDVEIFFSRDASLVGNLKSVKFSFEKNEGASVLFLSELSALPLLQHRAVATKSFPLNLQLQVFEVLRLSNSLGSVKPIVLLGFQSGEGLVRRFFGVSCREDLCSLDGYSDDVAWNFLASVRFK